MLHGRYSAADETRQLEQSYIFTINKIKRSYRLLRRRARSHSIPVTTTTLVSTTTVSRRRAGCAADYFQSNIEESVLP